MPRFSTLPAARMPVFVLIEALRGRISAHADVHAVVIAASIGEVQQDEVEVLAARSRAERSLTGSRGSFIHRNVG